MSVEEESGFLTRWSRRKREREPPPEQAPDPPPDQPQAAAVPDLPEIDLSLLPRIEDLRLDSDVSLFLRPGIPSALRSAALRRMWSLDPAIRDFIGPADYAWDYNNPAGMPPGFSLEIGEGVRKLLAQAIGEPDEDAPKPVAAEAQADAVLPEEPPGLVAETVPALPEPTEPEAEAELPRRRHGGAMPA
jgi:hypothetical protein